ncbi:MAG: preprotein translocase subunit SecE [Verrucomicrobia bacterium TMED71]|jgi:preprotein translocase subunit SecE|uniref:preprotein translocase subunit SecE n=1 Tax=Candidatus Pelagisphaera phototrophica TaxID=2684113 RepID=UPI000B70650B|nr:preprotein translocase subunit SecE [Candidatus Pelagisphaera phototrophica]QXD31942.1 preprotein translocase subunit SecE [Candidatus Pelagisphaera phototrophica]RPF80352.1 MAG: preprotein translocase subunit SecE [Verrucomicrobia bacterium TMED71]|tara:strand:+ start:222 stop:425 length:204 start_codon:yes stop_codon:yes gene_type:complete
MKNPFRNIRLFASETWSELHKASWPTRTELRDHTIVVLISVAILGLFIAVADFSLANVVNLFTGWMR